MRRQELSAGRVVLIYLAGVVAGVQGGLYLFDVYDDRVADWRSGLIALAFVAAGVAFIALTFRRRAAVRSGVS
ncbi:MAG TPA: hypothetical protein VFJ16_21005 [Longimicrobium sp.]|nr:hypothetical protein [Longimicrobium sp.]